MRKITGAQLVEMLSRSQFGGDPNRAYDGQPHTFGGARGRTLLPPHMTLRDLGDLVAERYRYIASLSEKFGGGIDVDALVQNVLCEVEQDIAPPSPRTPGDTMREWLDALPSALGAEMFASGALPTDALRSVLASCPPPSRGDTSEAVREWGRKVAKAGYFQAARDEANAHVDDGGDWQPSTWDVDAVIDSCGPPPSPLPVDDGMAIAEAVRDAIVRDLTVSANAKADLAATMRETAERLSYFPSEMRQARAEALREEIESLRTADFVTTVTTVRNTRRPA